MVFLFKVIISISVFSLVLTPITAQDQLGIFDDHSDIGDCKFEGFVYYNNYFQTYTIGASGKNMWFGEDEFHYLYTQLEGDFVLTAEVELLGDGVDPHRKAGWIVKNDLKSNSPHINACVHGDGLTSLQYRKSKNGDTEETTSEDVLPDIIKLERRGDRYIMSTAKHGEDFIIVESQNSALNKQVYVGLYVCSHNADVVEVARFKNVSISRN